MEAEDKTKIETKIKVKICGIRTPEALEATLDGGADYVGFVFYAKSSRYLPLEKARELSRLARGSIERVALFVDASLETICRYCEAIEPEWLQLHGETVDASFVKQVRAATGCKIIGVCGVPSASSSAASVFPPSVGRPQFDDLFHETDMVLLDTSVPDLYGGTGQRFDWSRLEAFSAFSRPLMVAGGIRRENLQELLAHARAGAGVGAGGSLACIDLSSGVERAPGEKDPRAIKAFLKDFARAQKLAAPVVPAAPVEPRGVVA